jgi:hypothetical protein
MQTPLSQILEKKGAEIFDVTSATTVTDAVRNMNSHGIGWRDAPSASSPNATC